jgi:CRP/FNR family cyclic AMP-dependent transcriptional regulator
MGREARHDDGGFGTIVAPLAGDRSLRGQSSVKRLRPEQRDALERQLAVRDYRRGEVIYRAEEAASALYVVMSGVVRLAIPMPNGRRVLLHLLPSGEIFGHSALVEGGGPRVFEASAYTDLRLGRIGTEEFLTALAGPHARVAGELVSLVTERWISLVLRLARFLAQDLQGRVASSLIEAGRGFGVEDARGHVLALRITQEAIADLSAGSVRKVNGVLRRFEASGLISKVEGRIILRRLDALEELALRG